MSENFGDGTTLLNESATVMFQLQGVTDRWIDFGNVTKVSGDLGVKKISADYSVNGLLVLAKNVTSEIKPVFTISTNEFPAPMLKLLYGGTTRTAVTQTAATGSTLSTTNVAPYDVVRIPGYNPSITFIKQGTTTLVQGVDYDIVGNQLGQTNVKSNSVRFRSGSTFVDGTQTIIITYNLPTITATGTPKIWTMDAFNQLNLFGTIQIAFTDQYTAMADHVISGACYLSPSKLPDYEPDKFCEAEFQASFSGPATIIKAEY